MGRWIAGFLGSRTMSVVCVGCVSDPYDVGRDVPQGSVYRSSILLIYVNHITQYVSCDFKGNTHIPADDFKLYLHFSREQ